MSGTEQNDKDASADTRPVRTQALTEKGLEYQRTMKLKIFKKMLGKLERDGKALLDNLTNEDETDQTSQDKKIQKWKHNYVFLLQTDGELCSLLEEGYEAHKTEHEERMSSLNGMRAMIDSLMPVHTSDGDKPEDCLSVKSRSSRSSRSSTGSAMKAEIFRMKMKESQHAAEMKARAAALEEKQKLEREMKMMESKMQELRWKEEQHKLHTEQRVQQAKEEAIETMEREVDSFLESTEKQKSLCMDQKGVSTEAQPTDCHELSKDMAKPAESSVSAPPFSHPQPQVPESIPVQVTASTLVNLLSQQAQRCQLPPIEPNIFRGDNTTFHMWLKAFEAYIEARCSSPSERLHYLGYYTAGEARNSILGYLQMRTDDAYLHAKRRLMDRYGNPFITANELKRRLHRWSEVKAGDSKALTELSDFLEQCLVASRSVNELHMFSGPSEVDLILRKLPRYLTDSWRRVVDRWIYEPEEGAQPQYPPFTHFVQFLSREARVASGPVAARNREEERKAFPKQKERNARVLLTSTPANLKPQATSQQIQQRHCVVCKKDHSVDQCSAFARMSLKERQELVFQRGLCGGCLKRGHRWKECKKKQRCAKCDRLHPTLLHDDNFSRRLKSDTSTETTGTQTSATSLHVTSSEKAGRRPKCTHSMLVPVHLKHKDRPAMSKSVYALLDPQSDTCFLKESVLQEMGLSGEEVALEVNTMTGSMITRSQVIQGLVIEALAGEAEIELPPTYSKEDIPADRQLIPRCDTTAAWAHLRDVSKSLPEYLPDAEIGILIGISCPRALKPLEIVTGGDSDPWAVRTSLGWSVVGYMGGTVDLDDAACMFVSSEPNQERIRHFAFRVRTREVHPEQLARMFDSDFSSQVEEGVKISQDDKRFLEVMENDMRQRPDGRFEAPLPLRDEGMTLPDNLRQAQLRLESLKRKLQRDSNYKNAYVAAMDDMLSKGYAEPVPQDELEANDGRVWYVPHHGVVQQKKNKLRVVFDCSVEFSGRCLNRELLQGPDVSNNLVGILTRFRKEAVALTCDIEAMFNRVMVTSADRNLLRFIWWPEGDVEKEPVCYRMTTHLFGAISSPACAMHALNLTADLYESKHGPEAANFVKKDFYVDDGLTSTPDSGSAISLIENTTKLCAEGGFKLGKFACNNSTVLKTIPIYSRSKSVVHLTANEKPEVCEQALGVKWDLATDTIQFGVHLPDRPSTRRGILSGVSSLYDPLGLISPVILRGKMIVKELCGQNCTWDDPVPDELNLQWLDWKSQLSALSSLKIPRQYGSTSTSSDSAAFELHHFSDASTTGYGACSYLRIIRDSGEVSCDLVMSKAKVTPKKTVTVPRLELAAAVLATQVGGFLQRHLEIPEIQHHYWCDSRVVLGYIRNNTRRFHVYVANRVQTILNCTSLNQWHFIPSDQNPSDLASRGCLVEELADSDLWWHGPSFLSCPSELPLEDNEEVIDQQDPEVKRAFTLMTKSAPPEEHATLLERLEHFPSWYVAKRAVANCMRYMKKLQEASRRRAEGDGCSEERRPPKGQLTVHDLMEAEVIIIKTLQREVFEKELLSRVSPAAPSTKNEESDEDDVHKASLKQLKKKSSLRKLDPVIRNDGVLCVGGRIRRANLPQKVTNPVILPKTSHVTTLIIRQCHERTGHAGREMTLGEVRQQGYWILHGRSAVSSYILRCVQCRKLRGPYGGQKMSDLPVERLQPSAPFTFCGVDCFGPFFVKERRSQVKRWGIIFTCLSSRAVHLETVNAMSTDAFLNAYRRFVCRRGPVQRLYCDNGTNFVGGQSALKVALGEMDQQKIKTTLLRDSCDWIDFTFNPPHASHMGGVWERLIRCARSALTSLLMKNGEQLDDELLRTLMCEAEDIINSRPISVADMSPTNQLEPLSPSFLLTQKCRVVLPFPGRFTAPDVYARQRWRRVQHLSNDFWSRWRREIVSAAQERRKWKVPEPNFRQGDVVLMVDPDLPRSSWPLARVIETRPSGDGLVRTVRVKTGASTYERPVHRLVMVLPVAELQ